MWMGETRHIKIILVNEAVRKLNMINKTEDRYVTRKGSG